MSTLKKRNGIYYYHHNQHRISLKTKDKKIALKMKDIYDLKRLTGQLDQGRIKVLDLCDKYLTHLIEEMFLADSTRKKVVHQVSMFMEYIRNEKANKYIDEVTPDLFHRYATWRDIGSVKNDLMSLSKMFKWGVSQGLHGAVEVPFGAYHIKKSHKHRPITHEEFKLLLVARHATLFEWLYYTGLRPSDVIRVHESMIEGRILTITPQKTEHSSGKKVVIILHKSLEPPAGFKFQDYLARPSLLDSARREIKRILGKEVTLYSLRYSFNQRLKEIGADIELRKDAMGHTNIRTTEGYSQQDVERMAKYIDMME